MRRAERCLTTLDTAFAKQTHRLRRAPQIKKWCVRAAIPDLFRKPVRLPRLEHTQRTHQTSNSPTISSTRSFIVNNPTQLPDPSVAIPIT